MLINHTCQQKFENYFICSTRNYFIMTPQRIVLKAQHKVKRAALLKVVKNWKLGKVTTCENCLHYSGQYLLKPSSLCRGSKVRQYRDSGWSAKLGLMTIIGGIYCWRWRKWLVVSFQHLRHNIICQN